jgi:hypothetical protein
VTVEMTERYRWLDDDVLAEVKCILWPHVPDDEALRRINEELRVAYSAYVGTLGGAKWIAERYRAMWSIQ